MRKFLLRGGLLLSMALNVPMAYAQYAIKGVLVDSLTQEGEPYATVRVLTEHPEKVVKAVATEVNGQFEVKLNRPGQYQISFSSIGKQNVFRKVTLDAQHQEILLGKVLIQENAKMLGGVNIVAQRTLVKADIDKLAYNVEEDPDAKTNTVLEMLRKVPMVSVDGEDKIEVNGSTSFKVHVDGKPNSLMSNNPSEVLKSLPASAIKSIEVITEPGAKYDAEGVGGILNIITVGTQVEGYNVTLGTKVHNKGIGANGYGTVQVGKFTVSGNYSYNYNDSPKGYNNSGREDFTSVSNKYLTTDGWSKNKGSYQYGNLNASYEIDQANLLTLSASLYGGARRTNRHSLTQMADAEYLPVYSYESHNHSKTSYYNVNASFDYQHSFKTPGEYLTLSYRFDHNPNGNETSTDYLNMDSVPFFLRNQYFDNDSHTSEHTAQVDYVNPINKYHYIDAGMKYIYRDNKSDALYLLQQSDGTMQEDLDQSTHFNQSQNIWAAYADYQLKWRKLGIKAGARYEHSCMDVAYKLRPEQNFEAHFNDIVPTANVAYMFTPTTSLRANYNLRINRPSIWYLNPFRDNSNPTSVSYGNPDLDTEKSHNLGLTYSTFSAKFSANIGVTYMFTDNGIEQYSFMNDGILETTYANAGKKQTTQLSSWMNWNPGSLTRISLTLSGSYSDFKSHLLDTHNSGFSGRFNANVQQTLPWGLRLSAYGGGSTPSVSLQGKGNSYYYYGLSLNRSFLKEDRLNVAISGSNLFNKYQTYKSSVTTDTFHSWQSSKYHSLRFGINVSWRLGDLKTKVKETVRTINNDDLKAGGGEGGEQGQSGQSGMQK